MSKLSKDVAVSILKLVPHLGVEPRNNTPFERAAFTNLASGALWWVLLESNQWSSRCQRDDLAANLKTRYMVLKRRLELLHLSAQRPQRCVSTNSTTWAWCFWQELNLWLYHVKVTWYHFTTETFWYPGWDSNSQQLLLLREPTLPICPPGH